MSWRIIKIWDESSETYLWCIGDASRCLRCICGWVCTYVYMHWVIFFSRNGELPTPTPAPSLSPPQQASRTFHWQRIFSVCRHKCDGKRHGQKVLKTAVSVRPSKWNSSAAFRAQEAAPQRICRPLTSRSKKDGKILEAQLLGGSRVWGKMIFINPSSLFSSRQPLSQIILYISPLLSPEFLVPVNSRVIFLCPLSLNCHILPWR